MKIVIHNIPLLHISVFGLVLTCPFLYSNLCCLFPGLLYLLFYLFWSYQRIRLWFPWFYYFWFSVSLISVFISFLPFALGLVCSFLGSVRWKLTYLNLSFVVKVFSAKFDSKSFFGRTTHILICCSCLIYYI